MCGISGIVGVSLGKEKLENQELIRKMAVSMAYRGPDGTAAIHNMDGSAYLAMNTLLIVNDKGEIGPYWNNDGNVMLSFNGEIYNYRELAKEWGIELTGRESDSHVILAGYELLGPEFVNHLDGMFAIAIFDDRSKMLHLYRDRMGEKPLYYKIENGVIRFASEVKALGGGLKNINNDFLTYENTLGEDTPYDDIHLLSPGHRLEFDTQKNHIRKQAYWSLDSVPLLTNNNKDQIVSKFEEILDRAIESRMPQRPFGLLLSGGLDSSLLAVKMKPDYVFTVGYSGIERFDEIQLASKVAQQIGAQHIIIEPTPEDFKQHFAKVVNHLDYPMGNSSPFSEYMLYKAAAKTGIRVLISGIGMDELMMGYARHALFFADDNSQSPLSRSYDPLVQTYRSRVKDTMFMHEKYYELVRRGPGFAEQKDKVRELFSLGNDLGQSVSRVDLAVNFPSLLKSADKLSSAFGLEVRSPYLAQEFVEYAYSLPLEYKLQLPSTTKLLLRDYARLSGVLDEIVDDNDKIGFSTPTGKWLKNELAGWFSEAVRNVHIDPKVAHLINNREDRGEYDRSNLQLLSLALWN